MALLFMALGQRDVSKVQLGELTPYTYVCVDEIGFSYSGTPLIRTLVQKKCPYLWGVLS